jgi:hypothetical protein
MGLCPNPLHPRRKDGAPKKRNNCTLCSPGRRCWNPLHPRRLNGKAPTKLGCWACTPQRFCFDPRHPRGRQGRPRNKRTCPGCAAEHEEVVMVTPLKVRFRKLGALPRRQVALASSETLIATQVLLSLKHGDVQKKLLNANVEECPQDEPSVPIPVAPSSERPDSHSPGMSAVL